MNGLILILDRTGKTIAQLESVLAEKDAHIAKQAEALRQNAERIVELEALRCAKCRKKSHDAS